jgi:hypothetical protein
VDTHRKGPAFSEVYPVDRELDGLPTAGDDARHKEQSEDGEDQRDRHPQDGDELGVLLQEAPEDRQDEEDQRR